MNKSLKKKIIESEKLQVEIARELNIQDSHLSKIVNAWIVPKIELKEKIAQILNCKVNDIF